MKFPPNHSDYIFTTMISWMDYAKYKFTIYKKCLFILTNINNELKFRYPIGKISKNIFDELMSLSEKQNIGQPVSLIGSESKDWILKNYPDIKIISYRDYFDYVYLSSDLAELPGSKYSKIRNRLNKFKKNFTYEIDNINENNLSEVKEFLKRWCLWKDCESNELLKNEKNAIIYSMNNFLELDLSGIMILINGKIEAISVFEKMNKNNAVVHYEKGSPYFDGIYKAINQESAKILTKYYKYINREPDMGIPGLRKAKLSYRPHHMVEVYHIEK
jgi:hypothetical protein